MVAIEPDVHPMGRYSATETSSALGIDPKTLRKYTSIGLIKCGIRRATNRKFYSGRDIIALWRATYL